MFDRPNLRPERRSRSRPSKKKHRLLKAFGGFFFFFARLHLVPSGRREKRGREEEGRGKRGDVREIEFLWS